MLGSVIHVIITQPDINDFHDASPKQQIGPLFCLICISNWPTAALPFPSKDPSWNTHLLERPTLPDSSSCLTFANLIMPTRSTLVFFAVLCASSLLLASASTSFESRHAPASLQQPLPAARTRASTTTTVVSKFTLDLLPSSRQDRRPVIYGGYDAPQRTANYLAYVQITHTFNTSKFCSGVVISRQHVLTTAHCFFVPRTFTISVRSVRVLIGERDLVRVSNTSIVYTASSIHILPSYNRSRSANDVAVITLSESLPATQRAAVYTKKKVPDGTVVSIAGYGATEKAPGRVSTVLQQTELQYVKMTKCMNMTSLLPQYKKSKMCFGSPDGSDPPHTSCGGDSGSPLFMFDEEGGPMKVLAINSYGVGPCGSKEKLSVGMKLKTHRLALRQIVNGNSSRWEEIFPDNESKFDALEL